MKSQKQLKKKNPEFTFLIPQLFMTEDEFKGKKEKHSFALSGSNT